MSEPEPRPSIRRLRERKERHQQRGRLYRIVVAIIGVLVILVGLVLVPLPGPGWLIVAVGVGIIALESDRAERLLEKILDRVESTTERLSPWQKRTLVVLGLVGAGLWVFATLRWEIPLLPG